MPIVGKLSSNGIFLIKIIQMKVHGTADDNVHLAHSMHISKTLIENGIMFKQMVRIVTTIIIIVVFLVNIEEIE